MSGFGNYSESIKFPKYSRSKITIFFEYVILSWKIPQKNEEFRAQTPLY